MLSPEREFASAAIQALGKIASSISDITDACLGGLISLLSNKNGECQRRTMLYLTQFD